MKVGQDRDAVTRRVRQQILKAEGVKETKGYSPSQLLLQLSAGFVGDNLSASDFQPCSQIIGSKGQLVLSRGDCHRDMSLMVCRAEGRQGALGMRPQGDGLADRAAQEKMEWVMGSTYPLHSESDFTDGPGQFSATLIR